MSVPVVPSGSVRQVTHNLSVAQPRLRPPQLVYECQQNLDVILSRERCFGSNYEMLSRPCTAERVSLQFLICLILCAAHQQVLLGKSMAVPHTEQLQD